MPARNHADDAAFGSGPVRGVTPPLLPTLMMAAILGAASYFCHEPVTVEAPAPVLATAVAAAPEAVVDAPFIPASLAFQTQFPMIVGAKVQLQAEATPVLQPHKAPARPARLAAPRRAEPARVVAKVVQDKATPVADRPLPFAAEADETPESVAAADDGVLPMIALPFVPTIRAVTQASAAAGAFVGAKGVALGAETANLGAAMTGWVGGLR